ncbi:hypothetical protein Actkin_01220 [Actinokineospora sp. UTMC 2448]|nr:hypothetical protein Actkin_01220 [Actinokineospora sp. UTMC 2448]
MDIRFANTGLVKEYEANAAGAYERWEPMEFDGYPAVVHDGELRDCHAVVGLSDTTTVHIWYRDQLVRPEVDTCGPVTRIAPAVLATIRATQ